MHSLSTLLHRKIIAWGCLISVLSLTACGEAVGKKTEQKTDKWDLVAYPVPFAKPVIASQTTLPGAAVLPAANQQILMLRRAFFAGDFAVLEAAIMKSHQDYLTGKGQNLVAMRLLYSLDDTQLAGIDACDAWLRSMPQSYAAHWFCGTMWHEGARKARSGKFAREVSAVRFTLMYERLQRAIPLLERATTLTPKPIEALAALGNVHYYGGDAAKAEGYLQRAKAIMPQHEDIYDTRLNYALPQWGGSAEQVKAVYEEARQAGLSASDLFDLHDVYIARPGLSATPGAPRAYWERVIKEHPTRQRLKALLNDFIVLENWLDALPVADRLIAEYPEYSYAYYRRGQINENLGRMAEARTDYTTAAAMGEDFALQSLILANIRGGLGITQKNFDTVITLCRYGAALGSGVGANCIGSLYFEGGSEGVPHPKDAAQGLAWHLIGARAGHYNSQHDLGWLLFTNRGGDMKEADAKKLGIFWLRRAAEQGHNFAKRKLEAQNISLSENTESLSLLENGFSLHTVVALWNALWTKIFEVGGRA